MNIFLSASILARGVVRFEGYLSVPFGLSLLQPGTFQAWPRSVVSSLASRSGPEESREEVGERRNSLPVYILYGSWNFWNYGLPA